MFRDKDCQDGLCQDGRCQDGSCRTGLAGLWVLPEQAPHPPQRRTGHPWLYTVASLESANQIKVHAGEAASLEASRGPFVEPLVIRGPTPNLSPWNYRSRPAADCAWHACAAEWTRPETELARQDIDVMSLPPALVMMQSYLAARVAFRNIFIRAPTNAAASGLADSQKPTWYLVGSPFAAHRDRQRLLCKAL